MSEWRVAKAKQPIIVGESHFDASAYRISNEELSRLLLPLEEAYGVLTVGDDRHWVEALAASVSEHLDCHVAVICRDVIRIKNCLTIRLSELETHLDHNDFWMEYAMALAGVLSPFQRTLFIMHGLVDHSSKFFYDVERFVAAEAVGRHTLTERPGFVQPPTGTELRSPATWAAPKELAVAVSEDWVSYVLQFTHPDFKMPLDGKPGYALGLSRLSSIDDFKNRPRTWAMDGDKAAVHDPTLKKFWKRNQVRAFIR